MRNNVYDLFRCSALRLRLPTQARNAKVRKIWFRSLVPLGSEGLALIKAQEKTGGWTTKDTSPHLKTLEEIEQAGIPPS